MKDLEKIEGMINSLIEGYTADNVAVSRMYKLSSIIELKKLVNKSCNKYDTYRDLKLYIIQSLLASNELNFEYDDISREFLIESISMLDLERQRRLLLFVKHELARAGFCEQDNWAISYLKNVECEYYFVNKKYIRWIIYRSTNNIKSVFVSMLIIYIFASIVLMPAISPEYALFAVSYDEYCRNFIFNHFINTLSMFFKFGKSFMVYPLNMIGVIVEVMAKIAVFMIIVNYVMKELIRRLNL